MRFFNFSKCSINSIDQRLNKLIKDLKLEDKKLDILAPDQSEIFWDETRSLKVFSNLNKNLFRIVVPPSETYDLLNNLSKYNIKYFVDKKNSNIGNKVDEYKIIPISTLKENSYYRQESQM